MILMVESIIFTISVCLSIVLLNLYGEKKKIRALTEILEGVKKEKLQRLLKELRRKTFHFLGLLLPLIYYFGTEEGLISQKQSVVILGSLTFFAFTLDFLRRSSETFRYYILKLFPIIRKREKHSFSGSSWLFLGATITIFFFEKKIASAGMMFLIVGDTFAAIFGITYGKRKLVGDKSLEGTMAMFFVCFGIGMIVFNSVRLFEYIAFVGALSASLAELLIEGIDDNLHIPLISSICMSLAWFRLKPLELETC